MRGIVERFAGEMTDPSLKTHLQAFGLGRAAMTMRSWVINAVNLWYKRGTREDLLGGRTVIERDGKKEVVWVGRPTEGIIQTMTYFFNRVRGKADADTDGQMMAWRKRNMALVGIHAGVIGLLIMALRAFLDAEDEEEGWSMGEETLRYTLVNGLSEQLNIGVPWLVYNDISQKPSAILGVFENTVDALWETAMLPIHLVEPDKLTESGKLSKDDRDSMEHIEHWVYQMSKAANIGGRVYRDARMMVSDVFIGEGNPEK
jgi:hypothetical protein